MFSRLNWTLSEQFGLSPRKFLHGVLQTPWYVKSLVQFWLENKGSIEIMPCLHDRHEASGSANSEYFWQDLFVAQRVFDASPKAHLDVGSRIDGFVAHIASYRVVEVVDIRPNPHEIPNVKFTCMDLMATHVEICERFDSISCLHALEHFGLGRYGDALDPNGWKKGLKNIAQLLSPGGALYLSIPAGKPRVVFNAHRVFLIDELIEEMVHTGLNLRHLHYIEPGKPGVKGGDIILSREKIRNSQYTLAILVATKDTIV